MPDPNQVERPFTEIEMELVDQGIVESAIVPTETGGTCEYSQNQNGFVIEYKPADKDKE